MDQSTDGDRYDSGRSPILAGRDAGDCGTGARALLDDAASGIEGSVNSGITDRFESYAADWRSDRADQWCWRRVGGLVCGRAAASFYPLYVGRGSGISGEADVEAPGTAPGVELRPCVSETGLAVSLWGRVCATAGNDSQGS